MTLTIISRDGDQGYPGTVMMRVIYTLTDESELKIQYEGTTDKLTILNPTHHSYFNLTGDFTQSILDHELMIDADHYTPMDKGQIPTGEFTNVNYTPMDFRISKSIGLHINDKYEQL